MTVADERRAHLEALRDKNHYIDTLLRFSPNEPLPKLLDLTVEVLLGAVERNLDQLAADQRTPSAAELVGREWRDRWRRTQAPHRLALIEALAEYEEDTVRQLVSERVRAAVKAGKVVSRGGFAAVVSALKLPPGTTWEMVEEAVAAAVA